MAQQTATEKMLVQMGNRINSLLMQLETAPGYAKFPLQEKINELRKDIVKLNETIATNGKEILKQREDKLTYLKASLQMRNALEKETRDSKKGASMLKKMVIEMHQKKMNN